MTIIILELIVVNIDKPCDSNISKVESSILSRFLINYWHLIQTAWSILLITQKDHHRKLFLSIILQI